MRNPRTNILLPIVSFIVIGLVGLSWLARGSDSAVPADSNRAEAPAVQAVAAPGSPTRLSEIFVDASATDYAPLSVASRPAVPPQPLSPDAGLLVARMCDLHLLADGRDFTLDSDQWPAFAAVVLRFEAIRQNYEASIASVTVVAPGRFRMEIPAYAGFGDELREQFFAELRVALGKLKSREVMAKLGDQLEGMFAGFGISEQRLDITADATGQPYDIQVTRTARYWNTVENGAATRCETHLPVLEDSTGDNWDALLAMVKAGNAINGPG